MPSRLLPFGALVVVALAFSGQEAAAQGRGRPKAPKAPKASSSTSSTTASGTSTASVETSTSGALSPVVSIRQFGSWLDDASAAAAHEGRTGIGMGYWRVDGGSQLNLPMVDVSYAFTDRVQASASVPFYRSNFEGSTARGLDDLYLAGKMTLVDPSLTVSEFGMAVGSVVEVLSPGTPDRRVHFAFPVSVELRRQPFRVFGSAGYFSRGSVFTAGALEWSSAAGYAITAAVTQSYSTRSDATLDALGVGSQRADVTGSISYPLGQLAAAYVSVGRSLTSVEQGGTTLSLAGGVSFRFTGAKAAP